MPLSLARRSCIRMKSKTCSSTSLRPLLKLPSQATPHVYGHIPMRQGNRAPSLFMWIFLQMLCRFGNPHVNLSCRMNRPISSSTASMVSQMKATSGHPKRRGCMWSMPAKATRPSSCVTSRKMFCTWRMSRASLTWRIVFSTGSSSLSFTPTKQNDTCKDKKLPIH